MKKTDLAYTAGIIDGEGCIHIMRVCHKNIKGGIRMDLRVDVGSTDEWLCQYLKFNWGGSISCHKYANRPKWSDSWHWILQCSQAAKFLKTILPYLHLKQPQAELAIQFQAGKGGRGAKRSENKTALEQAQYIAMRHLKKQGKSLRGEIIP